jgi:PadR family transcriptional regulator, regulatory protein AphA
VVAAELPDSTYAILGLVDKVPGSSGYDLVAVAGRSFAYFWPISQTLLYRELDRLNGLGWVTATRVVQTRVPSKWTYQITEDGKQALTGWLARPARGVGGLRSPVLLRVFFAHRMHPDQLRALLAAYRGGLQAQHDELQAIADKLAEVATPAARSGRLTALHVLLTAAAGMQWVDEVQAQLGRDDPG